MTLSSAYIFGNKITPGQVPTPLPSNVYFDAGRFNEDLLPQGFNWLNNIHRATGLRASGERELEVQYPKPAYIGNGTMLACYGEGGSEMTITNEGIEHAYELGSNEDTYYWTAYYLPVSVRPLEKNYTKIVFTVACSSQGYPDTPQTMWVNMYPYVGIVYDNHEYSAYPEWYMLKKTKTTSYSYGRTLIETRIEVPFSDIWNIENTDFLYVFIAAQTAGTYIFRKIWFE